MIFKLHSQVVYHQQTANVFPSGKVRQEQNIVYISLEKLHLDSFFHEDFEKRPFLDVNFTLKYKSSCELDQSRSVHVYFILNRS